MREENLLSRRDLIVAGSFLPFTGSTAVRGASCHTRGSYSGKFRFDLLSDGRYMRTVEDVEYLERCGVRWPVPGGATVDGASIPRALWTIVGAPFEGKYRNASVIHDWYCAVRTRSAHSTHRMFHEAMLASSVDFGTARMMYLAVRMFGPSWDDLTIDNNLAATQHGKVRLANLNQEGLKTPEPNRFRPGVPIRDGADALTEAGLSQESFIKAAQEVERGNFGLDRIDEIASARQNSSS